MNVLSKQSEILLAKIIAIGAGLTTIFIVSGSVTDPVNAPKLLVLGIVACASLGVLLTVGIKRIVSNAKVLWVLNALFLIVASLSIFQSESPLSQGYFGTYGRNNGFLTYAFLSMLVLSSAALSAFDSHKRIIRWLLIAGIINVIYCLWVIVFGDFIGWNNPYGNILGTLGNPNFIGAFLGIFLASSVAFVVKPGAPNWLRIAIFLLTPVTAFEIYDSNAIQGRIVGFVGLSIVGFFLIREKFGMLYVWLYSFIVATIGLIAGLGALQIGPLSAVIYKTSVSLRGQYWLAGWNTGERNPWSGAGMDAFGDWYRRSRDAHALDLPGINTVVNAAHNVPLDMFAFGGWPLFLIYILIMSLGGFALLRMILRTRDYDPILSALTVGWIGYQLQSIISINQIGLAIWGWVLTGACISYERISRTTPQDEEQKSVKKRIQKLASNPANQYTKTILTSSVLGLVGLLLALPPFTADSKWRSAQLSRSVESIEETMRVTYFNPANSTKYVNNIISLSQAQFPDLALKYAREAVKWNPESFELWRVLYFLENTTEQEKIDALSNMKRLDPLNPDVSAPPK